MGVFGEHTTIPQSEADLLGCRAARGINVNASPETHVPEAGDQTALVECREAFAQGLAEFPRTGLEFSGLEEVDDGDPHPAGKGVTAKGGTVGARSEDAEDVRTASHGRDGQDPTTEGLAEGGEIASDSYTLLVECVPRAAKARLDLVEDQKDVVLIRERAKPG